jgi:hypothetical protein
METDRSVQLVFEIDTYPPMAVTASVIDPSVANSTLIAGDQLPADFDEYDVMWLTGEVVGAATFVRGQGGFDIGEIASFVIAADSQACSAEFASGSLQRDEDRQMVRRLFTGCAASAGGAVRTIYYTIVPWRNGYLTLAHMNADGASRNDVERQDAVFFQAVSAELQ